MTEEVGWLRIGYHPSARDRLRVVMPRLDEMRNELRETLGTDVLETVELRIAALDAEMVRLTPGEVAPTGRGQTFVDAHLIVLSAGAQAGGEAQDLESAIRYQLARLALAEAVAKPPMLPGDQDGAGGARPSTQAHRAGELPGWFEEGFAVHFARAYEASRTETLLFAWVRNDLPHVAELGSSGLSDRDPGAEGSAFSADFVRFVTDSRDRSTLPEVVAKLRRGESFDEAVAEALGSDRSGVDRAWRQDMAKRYALFPVLALSLVLWAALWLVGLVRRKRAIAASESTAARLRSLRRSRASDASALIVVSRARRDGTPLLDGAPRRDDEVQHDGVYADGPAPAPSSDRRRSVDPTPREIEVPKIEHDGDWHTLH